MRVTRRAFITATFGLRWMAVAPYAWQTSLPSLPLTVSIGTLARNEFEELALRDRQIVEQTTRELIHRYGAPWVVRVRPRLRAELWLAYGVAMDGASE
jgi:hypothetical protein